MHVRICPECGEEFRPEIVHCSDCGALLEDRHDDEGAGALPVDPSALAEPAPAAPEDYLPVFTSAGSDELKAAAASLAAAGVAFRASGSALSFQLLVRADDYAAAAQALGGRDGAVIVTPESVTAGDGASCPACSTALAPGSLECPECQLVLGEGDPPPLTGGRSDEQ
jgi:hypothetical protein